MTGEGMQAYVSFPLAGSATSFQYIVVSHLLTTMELTRRREENTTGQVNMQLDTDAKGAAAVAGSKMSAGRRNLGAAEVPGC